MADPPGAPRSADDPVTVGVVSALTGARLDGSPEVVLGGATHDSRAVAPGDLFCCVPGASSDGHDFAAQAVSAGAAALLAERPLGLGVPELLVGNVRSAMATAAAAIHGDPSESLAVVGVTGTNGKTTVVSLLGHLLQSTGHPVEVMGTLTGVRTTPESTDLQATLAAARDRGVRHVAMEVSSHALDLHRVDAVHFRVAVFTNLGVDHLDHHGTLEHYFAAKAKLFDPGRADLAVLNLDDERGRELYESARIPAVGYSLEPLGDLDPAALPVVFSWRGEQVSLPLPGRHNVSNALAAAEAAVALGLEPAAVAQALGAAPQVPGRFERVDAGAGAVAVVDYAHTPDALEAALRAAAEMRGPEGRLWVVFGCGGDRDAAKRPRMGQVACELADEVVLTNDNPRSEDPLRIIDAIRSGCDDEPMVDPERRSAIQLALRSARAGDVVLIAGKGHEQGQVFADRTEPFDDRTVAREAIGGTGHGGDGSTGRGGRS